MSCVRPAFYDSYDEAAQRIEELGWTRTPLGPGGRRLANRDRLIKLFGLTKNAYHAIAFNGLSIPECMRICADMLFEQEQFEKANRAYEAVDRVEARRKRFGHGEPPRPAIPKPSRHPIPPPAINVPPQPPPPLEQIYWDRLPIERQVQIDIKRKRHREAEAAKAKAEAQAAAPQPFT